MTASELNELPYLVGRARRVGDAVGAEELLAWTGGQAVEPLAAGDVLVGGLELGRGAATRAVPRALRLAGVVAVIARSFGEVFFRCAIHVGLPALQVEETAAVKSGDRLRVDVEGHKVVNLSSGDRYVIRNAHGAELDILRAGGWAEYVAATRGR
jgi:3-isopropylmalate dehydratase small subunit